ncbi:MAG: aspartate carbamoyltransferase [Conexivisphaera sp.]|jgi:aspartate carbamoyltransferase catalytic subunit|nr:aspartate carbamoyltransferase [Conexivisphaerales archaeon]
MLKGRDILSALDFEPDDIVDLMGLADRFRAEPRSSAASGRIMTTAFFEPSTRTRLSFTFAMTRLGGDVVDLGPEEVTSRAKGETFEDTIRMLDGYGPDLFVIRHGQPGSAAAAAEIAAAPVINAGDGTNEHPTQALTDLYTLRREYGRLDGLTLAMVGDLKYSRTTSSLSYALSKFPNNKVYYVSPPQLRMRPEVLDNISGRLRYEEVERLEDVKEPLHAVYMTRVQRERFSDLSEYERLKSYYVLTPEVLLRLPGRPIVMHPLPRIAEIPESLDSHPQSRYFQQAQNGMYVRMALIVRVLGLNA